MVKDSATQKSRNRGKNNSEKTEQFKGVRMRNWGKWVSEVRVPNSHTKIWLGSYRSPQQAARAFDCAVYCLRGSNSKFNFPECLPQFSHSSCLSLSPSEIQAVAAKFALQESPQSSDESAAFCGWECESLPSSSGLSEEISEDEGACALLEFLLDDSETDESSIVEDNYKLDMMLDDLQSALLSDEDRERTEILFDFLLADSEDDGSSNVEEHSQLDMMLHDLQSALFNDEHRERTEVLLDFECHIN